MCQPIVIMLVLPFQAELTSTIGPGSRNRRIFDTGKSFFAKALIELCPVLPVAMPLLDHTTWLCRYLPRAAERISAAALAQSGTVRPHGRGHACAATLPIRSSLSLDHRLRSR